MTNSGDKWPQGYKGFTSALKPYTPELTANVDTTDCTKVNLSWTYLVADCLPVNSILVYVNNILVATVNSSFNTYQLTLSSGSYTIFIKTVSNNIESQESNNINIII